jgi:phage tail-like protein
MLLPPSTMNVFSKPSLCRSRTGILSGLLVFTMLAVLPVRVAAAGAVPEVPLSAVRFELTIDGRSLASFSEFVGITSEIGGLIGSTGTIGTPPPTTVRVTLRRAMTRNIEMAAWHELVFLGDVAAARKSCSLTMYNLAGDPVARYHLTDAWPQKIEIGALKSPSGVSALTETITLICEFLQRVAI